MVDQYPELSELTEEQILELMTLMSQSVEPTKIECRAYYDSDGKIITYTTEKIDGDYIVITNEQYAEARPDARVIDGQLVFNNRRTHVFKLDKNRGGGKRTSKYDISIVVEEGPSSYYMLKVYEIKR